MAKIRRQKKHRLRNWIIRRHIRKAQIEELKLWERFFIQNAEVKQARSQAKKNIEKRRPKALTGAAKKMEEATNIDN